MISSRHLVLSAFAALFVHATCSEGGAGLRGPVVGGSGGSAGEGVGGVVAGGGGSGATASGGTAPGGTGGSGGMAPGGSGGAPGGSAGSGQGGAGCTGPVGQGASGPCSFPQGVPNEDFIAAACSYADTDPSVDAAVNAVMVGLTGCGVSSDCPITGFAGSTADEICQSWFAAVTAELRAQGYCAGQHEVGATDEIAVSKTGCTGKWYGYHICNYGGPKVVWNPGARRGWWAINPAYCP